MNASLADQAVAVLSDEVLDGLNRDTALVRGLPNAAFTTEAFLDLEYQTLFKRSWVFAGRASAVTNRGDVEPVEVAGSSLFMVRGSAQEIRVFHNVCPHRGARLVVESLQETASLTCPYHAWSYELDGNLKGRPHFHGPERHDRTSNGGETSDDRVCLFEVRSAVWHDWVFVNLEGAAQAFEDYIAPIQSHLDGWDLSQFSYAYHDQFEFRCNWKLAVENFSDYYHNFKVHPDMVGAAYVPEKSGPTHPAGMHLSLLSTLTGADQMFSRVKMDALPTLSGLSDDKRTTQPAAVIFPNTGMVISPAHMQFVYFEPIDAGRSIMHLWFYFVGDAADAPRYEKSRQFTYTEFETINKEDEGICLRLQEGRNCDAYNGGRLAPYWDASTAHFHRQVADAILAQGAFARAE